jgi:hypothetical protein
MYRISLLYFLIVFFQASCNNEKEVYDSPPGYDLQKPYKLKLPIELDEISGLAYYQKDSSVFAINDERGWLYKLGLGKNSKDITRWKFSSGADFEDLVLLDSSFYVLQSNGTLVNITFIGNKLYSKEIPFQFSSQNEFEIVYYDDQRKKLILICKECDSDKKKSLTTFTYDPQTGLFSDSSFAIDVSQIAASVGEKKIKFKPSAAAINPVDSLLYIVSAINKLVVVTDRNGKFKKSYSIDPSLFKQPEGITFTPWGSIIISNEAADIGVADILIFSPAKVRS